jgi:hypothetical protein
MFLSYHRSSFRWYSSSWVNAEPRHSGFKSQIVALSLWCVMFLVWQFFVANLLSVVLVLFPDTFYTFTYNSCATIIIGMTKHFMFHILRICT